MVKNAKKPKYWSNSNMKICLFGTKIVGKRYILQIKIKKSPHFHEQPLKSFPKPLNL